MSARHWPKAALAVACLFLTGCASSAGKAAPVPAVQAQMDALFVDGKDAAGWKRVKPAQFYPAERVFDYLDGYGEIPLSYNLELVGTALYSDDATRGTAKVDIYALQSSPDAFGLYTFERSPDAEFLLDLGPQGWFKDGSVAFWRGTCHVRIVSLAEKSDRERLVALARAIHGRITASSALPKNMHLLLTGASHSLVENSLKFFHQKVALDGIHFVSPENVLDLGKDTDGFVAPCGYKDQRWKMFLIRYPDAARAGRAFEHYRGRLTQAGYQVRAVQATAPSFVATKPEAKPVAAFVQGEFVGGVWDATTERFAEAPMKMLLKALPQPEGVAQDAKGP